MDRGAWQATVHGVTKSWTHLKQLSVNSGHFHIVTILSQSASIIHFSFRK